MYQIIVLLYLLGENYKNKETSCYSINGDDDG